VFFTKVRPILFRLEDHLGVQVLGIDHGVNLAMNFSQVHPSQLDDHGLRLSYKKGLKGLEI
jgi:hypothetical protein